MKDSKDEYLMLREEILHLDTMTNNTINFFYVFIATYMIFALNQDDTIFILISYIVIIPAYLIVISKVQGMYKIGAYLKVFHEGGNFNWESRRIMYTKNTKPNIFNYVSSINFPFIFVSVTVDILFLYNILCRCPLLSYEIGKIILCIVLSILLFILIYKNRSIKTEDFVYEWNEIKNKIEK